VLGFYRRADVFAIGCQIAENGDRDGIPNVLMESMSMGVPVVATDVGGIPELIVSGETGLLVPPASPELMALAIEKLLVDSKLRKRIIQAARDWVYQRFDASLLIGEVAEVYARHHIPKLNSG
jgi:glycosyltransferase involved in cell wall biosynthesis